jgi:predicted alpha/beta superfamily hydrolase
MKKTIVILFICLFNKLHAQVPNVAGGSIKRIDSFESKFVTKRNIDIWLPKDYSIKNKYAVLYMHDGQMLFDSAITWNKTAWDVDDVLSKLMEGGGIRNVIVVGIWNGGKTRHQDYFPEKPYNYLNQIQKDTITAQLKKAGRTNEIFKPNANSYLKFLVTELKPFIDKNYATKKDSKNTFIAGSSMGGLISMYAICEYPNVFGGAACLSTHWPGVFATENNPIPDAFVAYMSNHLPNPKNHKIYFDYGDKTLDALYPPLHAKVDATMKAKGFTNNNWITKYFPGENHSEVSWKKRLHIPLLFLMGK